MADKYSRKALFKIKVQHAVKRLRYLGKKMLIGSPHWSKAVADWFIGNADQTIRDAGTQELCRMLDAAAARVRARPRSTGRGVAASATLTRRDPVQRAAKVHAALAAEEVMTTQLLEGVDDTAEMAAGILNAVHHMISHARGATLANLAKSVQSLVIQSVGSLDSLGCMDALQVITKWHVEHPRLFKWDFIRTVHAHMQERLALGLHWLHANDPVTFRQLEMYHDMQSVENAVMATKNALWDASQRHAGGEAPSGNGGKATSPRGDGRPQSPLAFGSRTPHRRLHSKVPDGGTHPTTSSAASSSTASERRYSKTRSPASGPFLSPRQRRRSSFAEMWKQRNESPSQSNTSDSVVSTVTKNQIANLETTIRRLIQSQTAERQSSEDTVHKIRNENARLVKERNRAMKGVAMMTRGRKHKTAPNTENKKLRDRQLAAENKLLRQQLDRVRKEASGLMKANSELREMILDMEEPGAGATASSAESPTEDENTLHEIVRALEDTVNIQQRDYRSLEADLEEVYQDYSNETIALEGKLEAAEHVLRSYEQIFVDLGVAPPRGATVDAAAQQEMDADERGKQVIEQGIETIQDWLDESGPSPWPGREDDNPLTEEETDREAETDDESDHRGKVDSAPQRWGHSRTLTESFKSMNELGLE
jgi:hypothetical protein